MNHQVNRSIYIRFLWNWPLQHRTDSTSIGTVLVHAIPTFSFQGMPLGGRSGVKKEPFLDIYWRGAKRRY